MKKALPLFLLSWLFIMFSCKQDDFEPENHEHGKTENKQISFREFMEQQGSNPEVQKIKKYFTGTETGISAKNGDSLNWEIDTVGITQITTPELTTYTFRVIEHDTISGFRNVIIRDYNDEIRTFLVHYPDGVDFENHTSATVIVEELEGVVLTKAMPQCYGLRWQCQQCGMTMCNVEPGWVLIGQPCSDGGGGQGGGGYPGDPYADPGWPTDPGNSPWDGGGAGGGGGASETPCSALNRKSLDQTFKQKINFLKTKVNEHPHEWGWENYNPNEKYGTPGNGTNAYNTPTEGTAIKYKPREIGQHVTGYAHSHPDRPEVMGVHSTGDIRSFVKMVETRHHGVPHGGGQYEVNSMYGIVVGTHGVYAIKITNLNNFVNSHIFCNDGEWTKFWEDFEEEYKEKRPVGDENNNQKNNEVSILKTLQYHYKTIGITLFRASDDLSKWDQLSLNEAGTDVVKTPCN